MQSQEMDCWCSECVMVPHLVFIVHFIFSLKRLLHTAYSLYIICYYYGGEDRSFYFPSVSFFHGASITLTDCSQNFKRQETNIVSFGTPPQGYFKIRKKASISKWSTLVLKLKLCTTEAKSPTASIK